MKTDKKKVLFVAYLYPPVGGKGLPGVQRTVKFVRYLSGVRKYVLSLRTDLYPNFFSTENSMSLPISDEEIIRTGLFDVFGILLKWKNVLRALLGKNKDTDTPPVSPVSSHGQTAKGPEKSLFTRFKDMISGFFTFPDYAHPWIMPAVWRGVRLVKKEGIDAVFATGMPWSALVIGWLIKVFTGVRLIADFRDPWVNNPYNTGKSAWRKAAEKYLERKIVTAADAVSLNTEELRKDFVSRYPSLPYRKFVALVNGYDAADFRTVPLEQDKSSHHPGILMTHAGFLYGRRDPKIILQAIAKIRETDPVSAEKIVFMQMGDTELDYDLKQFVSDHSLGRNYDDRGPLPYSKCLGYMSQADILVIIQQDTKTQIPSKIYEYIYLNKPILTVAQKDGALGKMIGAYTFGEIFESEDIEGLADYLSRKLSDKEKSGVLNIAYTHRERFDVRNITKELEKVIEEICI